jgi:type 1 glutamine amidotransferase
MIIAEDEYRTEVSLPMFAAKHLGENFRVSYAFGSDTERNRILSLEDLKDADAVLVSVRRRPLPAADIKLIQQFVRSGKPMIGIRTASHPFSIRTEQLEEGLMQWPEFDREVWGGNYVGHYGNELKANLQVEPSANTNPLVRSLGKSFELKSGGSLYKTTPLAVGTTLLLTGSVEGKSPEPVAWTYVRADGGRSFYTSLGHVDDFAQTQFESLLSAGIHWACDLPLPNLDSITAQGSRYAAGKGRQRK